MLCLFAVANLLNNTNTNNTRDNVYSAVIMTN